MYIYNMLPNNWYSFLYFSFIITSIILFIISFFTSGKSSLGSVIAGYSSLSVGIFMILGFVLSQIINTNAYSSIEAIYQMFIQSGPFIMIIGVVAYSLYLLILYQNNIVNKQISDGYYLFNNISILLTLIQVYLIYTDMKKTATIKITNITSSILYFISIINIIIIVSLGNILKYFRTDGFDAIMSKDMSMGV